MFFLFTTNSYEEVKDVILFKLRAFAAVHRYIICPIELTLFCATDHKGKYGSKLTKEISHCAIHVREHRISFYSVLYPKNVKLAESQIIVLHQNCAQLRKIQNSTKIILIGCFLE